MSAEVKQSYNETEYPRAAEESETDSGTNDDEATIHNPQAMFETGSPLPVLNEDKDMISESDATQPELGRDGAEATADPKKDEGIVSSMTCGVCFQILLDPITLTCGHSFCQICLAQMWNMSQTSVLLCPMCRQPWAQRGGRLPSVNVIFRTILEHTFPDQINERRNALSEAEIDLAKRYNLQQQQQQRPPQTQRRVINAQFSVLCIFLAIVFFAVFISVFIITYALLALGGLTAADSFVTKPVNHWSNDDVMDWLTGLGDTVQKDSIDIFKKEKIDGRHLLILTKESLTKYGMENEMSRDSLMLSIDQLKEAQYVSPRNFDEYRAAHRKDTVLLLLSYKIFPRLTFGYVYFCHYYDIFLPIVQSQLYHKDNEVALENKLSEDGKEDSNIDDTTIKLEGDTNDVIDKKDPIDVIPFEPTSTQLIAIFIEILLVPHLVVAVYTFTGLQTDTILSLLILFHCVVATLREVRELRTRLRTRPIQHQIALKSLFNTAVIYCLSFVLLFIGSKLIFFLLPSVILDMLFYMLLIHVVLSIFYAPLVRPILNQFVRLGLQLIVHFNNR